MATPASDIGSSNPVKGILLMIAGLMSIQVVDGIAKHLSADYSPLFIGAARYALACLIVLPLAMQRFGADIFPREQLGSHLMRTVFLVSAMTFYFLAITYVPLATAISVSFVGPVFAVVLSLVVLKERMTWRKGLSLALGLAGALVIVRPETGMEPGILFALAAGITFACYIVATRHTARGSDPLKTLAFQSVAGALILIPQGIWTWQTPAAEDLVLFVAMAIMSTISHMFSIAAFRHAEASTLAPLVYCELIGAVLIGYFFFGEVPGAVTMAGAALIILAGLVLVKRTALPDAL